MINESVKTLFSKVTNDDNMLLDPDQFSITVTACVGVKEFT